MSNIEGRGKNIIILEGGGVGGLSPLFILGELMNRVKAAGGDPSIFKQFALVAGTGTGGVQACMLGRLRIQLDQVIPIFMKLLEVVFSEKKISMNDNASFKATHLEAELKKIVKNATGDENACMMAPPSEGEGCKTMIFAMSKHNMNASTPRVFRSYQGPANQMPDCTIWEALRATMAHPNIFKSIEIGELGMREEFVGGDMGCSNPVSHVLAEAALLYPNDHIASIVCIGTGHTKTIHIPKPNPLQRILPINILIAMKDIATDSERAAQDMAMRFQGTLGVYFRFSVDQGMQNVRMSEWQRQSEVVAHTRAYMQRADVNEKITSAAHAVKEQKTTIGVGYISKSLSTGSMHVSHVLITKLGYVG